MNRLSKILFSVFFAVASFVACTPKSPPPTVEIRFFDQTGKAGGPRFPVTGQPNTVAPLFPEILISNADIKSAKATAKDDGTMDLVFSFTEEGSKKFFNITRVNRNRRIGVVIDGVLLAVPQIRGPMQGSFGLGTQLPPEKAKELAKKINSTMAPK